MAVGMVKRTYTTITVQWQVRKSSTFLFSKALWKMRDTA
jgi:hypothetical protein